MSCPISGTEDGVPDRLEAVARSDAAPVFTHEFDASIAGTPGVAADRIVTPTVDGRLVGVSLDGDVEWRTDTDGAPSAVGVADDTAYVGTPGERLLAVDATDGAVRWTAPLRNTVFAPPLTTLERVYVGGADYHLRALDRDTGEQVWADEVPNAVTHGPFRVDDKLVTLAGGSHRIRGRAGALPHTPTVLTVHSRDGSPVRSVDLDAGVDGGRVTWLAVAGGDVYLGQEYGLSKLAPEVYADA
ncbi:PQQ-binding-like beta-propeller repeat protein [Halobaculum litoreum]|uniref:PQQ-binding-like beta-propeller repeat protein n=1 Tax=Halobaculum litoreum TaxID=3031998 RepID=A0ABD5XRG3_9EURY